MSSKEYSIAFAIAGKLSSDFAKSFKTAGDTVKNFEGKFQTLNRSISQMSGVLKMRRDVQESQRSFTSAKQHATEMGRAFALANQNADRLNKEFQESKRQTDALAAALKKAKSPTEELNRAFINSQLKTGMLARAFKYAQTESRQLGARFNSERAAVKSSEQELLKKKIALQGLEKANKTAGLSVQQLMQREKALTAEANRTRAAQEKLAAINAKSAALNSKISNVKSGVAGSIAQMSYIAAAGASFTLPVKQAMQMEDAMAEIKKVVDFKDPDGLQKMEKALERMSLTIPISAEGLAKITAAAGQAGIAEGDLLRFTETAAKMGVAFDISAEEAGEMMAKWRSGMNLTQDEAENLANATNALSNNNAALAKQVGEALKRYGALGKVAGLTETQTAAMAATIIGAGAEAEVAATGMNAFMRALTKGGSMTDLQKAAFGNIGFDALQLQKDIQTDAPKTIFAVLDAIKTKLPKELQMQYLTAMFGEEGARAMGPMLANTEKLRENFDLVADSEKYAGSMLNEFKSRSATTSNALELLQNSAAYVGRAIGKPMLQPLKDLSESVVRYATIVGDWINKNQGLTTTLIKVGVGLVSATVAFTALKIAGSIAYGSILSLGRGILLAQKGLLFLRNSSILATVSTTAFSAASKAAAVSVGVMKSAIGLLGGAMKFMFLNPVGIAVTAIGGLVLAGIYLYKNWDTVKQKLSELWSSFSEKFPGIAATVSNVYENSIKPTIEGIKNAFSGLIEFVSSVFSGNWAQAWEGAKNAFSSAFSALPAFAVQPLNTVIAFANKVIHGINSLASFKVPDWVPMAGGQAVGVNIPEIPMLASGGVATAPSLAMVGEGSEPEAILPLSQLGSMMGGAGGTSISVNFSPVIQISGSGASREDIQSGLRAGVADLKRELEKLLNSERRLSYS